MKTATFVLALLLVVAVASAAEPAQKAGRYQLTYSIATSADGKQIRYSIEVKDVATGEIVAAPTVNSQPRIAAEVRTGQSFGEGGQRDFHVTIRPDKTGSGGTITLEVQENGAVIQKSTYRWENGSDVVAEPESDPITLHLKGAEIHDVLKTFAQLTGKEMHVDPAVNGSVTIDLEKIPWRDALVQVVSQVGAKVAVENDVIRVTK